MGVPGSCARAAMAARSPSSVWVGGIRTSTTDTSGRCVSTASTRAGPSPTAATTWWPSSASSRTRPSRSSTASSATTIRSGPRAARLAGAARRAARRGQQHGSSAVIVVGPPSGLSPAARRRPRAPGRRGPRSPCPLASSAPPTPSSVTHTRRAPPPCRSPIAQERAWLCLATLVSASATTKYAAVSTAASSRRPSGGRCRARPGRRSERPARSAPRAARGRPGSAGRCRGTAPAAPPVSPAPGPSRRARASRTASGLRSRLCCARPSSIASRTSRCCGPSWMSRSSRRRAAASADTAATACARAVSRSCSSPLIRRSSDDTSNSSACPSPAWTATQARVTSGSVPRNSRPSVIANASCRPASSARGSGRCGSWRCPRSWSAAPRARRGCRSGKVMAATPKNHQSAVTSEVTSDDGQHGDRMRDVGPQPRVGRACGLVRPRPRADGLRPDDGRPNPGNPPPLHVGGPARQRQAAGRQSLLARQEHADRRGAQAPGHQQQASHGGHRRGQQVQRLKQRASDHPGQRPGPQPPPVPRPRA